MNNRKTSHNIVFSFSTFINRKSIVNTCARLELKNKEEEIKTGRMVGACSVENAGTHAQGSHTSLIEREIQN